jgi:hypothetical protein
VRASTFRLRTTVSPDRFVCNKLSLVIDRVNVNHALIMRALNMRAAGTDTRLLSHSVGGDELPHDLWGPVCNLGSSCTAVGLELKDTTSPIKYDKEATGQLKRTQTFQGFIANPMDLGDFPFVSFVAAAY